MSREKDLQPTTYPPQAEHVGGPAAMSRGLWAGNLQPGVLISFDGTDSSGKATQSQQLAQRFRELGRGAHIFTTPDYDTPSGRELKLRLQGKLGDWRQTPWQEKLRYFAQNRTEHREEVLEALKKGEVVIYDRYVPSSYAFIIVEAKAEKARLSRHDILAAVAQEEYEKNRMPREDLSIFLDVPISVSEELLEQRQRARHDAVEYTDHEDVQQQLYNEYDILCRDDPNHYARVSCVGRDNRFLGIGEIADLVWITAQQRLPQLK